MIPDGFTELIFHYGDAYISNLHHDRQTQARNLLAGQISNYFHLQNTGISGIVAVKLKPAGVTQLFNIDMSNYTDKIVDIARLNDERLIELSKLIVPFADEGVVKKLFDDYFIPLAASVTNSPVTAAIDLIFETNGMAPVKELATAAGVGERQLERLFKKYVGLSPKYYARIIRFNYIFKLIEARDTPWADIVYQAGYYDQSHFIRNFKAFTGEDPSSYYFDEDNMANFFLKKQP
jgi:AraC-like DNA-binding protein